MDSRRPDNGNAGDADEAARYVDQFLTSAIDGAFIHEAGFLYACEQPEEMWKQIARLTH